MKTPHRLIQDAAALLCIILVGLVLTSFLTTGDTLYSGYQDWTYHAFRVRRILEFGISSWDHVWANGLNLWRGYQFIPHLIPAAIASISSLSVTQSMVITMLVSMVVSRISLYLSMRALKIAPGLSLASTLISYNFAQQWQAMLDFSVLVPLSLMPLAIYIFAKSFHDKLYRFVTAAIFGWSFAIHPLAGIFLSPLFAITLLDVKQKTSLLSKLSRVGIYAAASAGFWTQHIFKPYSYTAPLFNNYQFAQATLPFDYLGLSLSYAILLGLAGLLLVIRGHQVSSWIKWLYIITLSYIGLVYAAYHDALPKFIYELQISRIVTYIGMVAPLSWTAVAHQALPSTNSRFAKGVIVWIVVSQTVQAINMASSYAGIASETSSNPVSHWFAKTSDSPMVYYENDSLGALSADQKVRFPGSYNEHLLPSPISYRFKRLMENAVVFDVKDPERLKLIDAYAQVVGINYFIIPEASSFSDTLSELTGYDIVDTAITDEGTYRLIQRDIPTSPAYTFSPSVAPEVIGTNQVLDGHPTQDFTDWDNAMLMLADAVYQGKLAPVKGVSFRPPSTVEVELTSPLSENESVLITQSFDPDWSSNASVEANHLRYIIATPNSDSATTIRLKHEWSWWHWPVQIGSAGVALSTLLSCFIFGSLRIRTTNKKENLQVAADVEDLVSIESLS